MRIGIFGGTFDPPHYAHLILAERTRDALELDKVYWVPVADPPHKRSESLTDANLRISMIDLAIASNAAFELSTVDIDRPGPHYAVDMVQVFKERYPRDQLYFLMGGDSLSDLRSWHQPQLLIQMTTLVVMQRPSVKPDIAAISAEIIGLEDRVIILDAPLVEIAATDIRMMHAAGKSVQYLLPDSVYRFIIENNLYLD